MSSRFGKELQEEFLLDKDTVFLNHGSYGSVPREIFNARSKLLEKQESNPDEWFRNTIRELWTENIAPVAKFLEAEPEDLVFVNNVMTGINSAIKSFSLAPGDGILVYSWQYRPVHGIAEMVCKQTGAEVICIDVPLPIESRKQIVDLYRGALDKNPNIKIAVIEGICSPTGVLMPYMELCRLCQDRDVTVVLDGAHMPGQIPLKMSEFAELGVSVFVGSLHKWTYVPRGCAVMWINPISRDIVRPAITNYPTDSPVHMENFIHQGTMDTSPFFLSKHAQEYYHRNGGMDVITSYTRQLLTDAVELLTKEWGTSALPVPDDMLAPNMRSVRLPDIPAMPLKARHGTLTEPFQDYENLSTYLREEKGIIAATMRVHGATYVRLSAQIYNHLDQYRYLAMVVKELAERV